jgi:hypothetical protein
MPWSCIFARPFFCPICKREFQGRTKRRQQVDHIEAVHPEFWAWRDKFGKIGYVFTFGYVAFLSVGVILQYTEGHNAIPTWYFPAFLGLNASILGMFLYWYWRIRGFKLDWMGTGQR